MTATTDRLRTILPTLAIAAGLLLTFAPTAPARGGTHEVAIADFAFSPPNLTITAGDTVTWTNQDAMVHTATAVDGSWDSGDLAQGASYSLTFTEPGTYSYLCTPHPSMTGSIVVVAAPSAAPSAELPNVAVPIPDTDRGLAPRLAGAALLGAAALHAVGRAIARRRGARG